MAVSFFGWEGKPPTEKKAYRKKLVPKLLASLLDLVESRPPVADSGWVGSSQACGSPSLFQFVICSWFWVLFMLGVGSDSLRKEVLHEELVSIGCARRLGAPRNEKKVLGKRLVDGFPKLRPRNCQAVP